MGERCLPGQCILLVSDNKEITNPLMTCAIIDDEPLAADLLASYVEKTPFLQLVGTYSSAVEAMKMIRNNAVDLLFLDIQMPELSGLEFATILPQHTMAVFTTAFDRYAVESYRVNALDYLLKPISYDSFLRSANKALQNYELMNAVCHEGNTRARFFFVKSGYKLVRVDFDEILYIEGVKDYVRLWLTGEDRNIDSLMNMKTLEALLPKTDFMRIHRSYIINLSKVQHLDHLRILIGCIHLPVSDGYKEAVMKYFSQHTIE